MLTLIQKSDKNFPPRLHEVPQPPEQLYFRGDITPLIDPETKLLCVVGSRRYTRYGKEVTEKLIAGLKGQNICIISGLALGIDGIAHRAALEAGLATIAFPGSGLDPSVLHPKEHHKLAEEIIAQGGALVAEFEPAFKATTWSFPARNRLMVGASHATLVIEGGPKSGSLISARLAWDYDRELGVVPGEIFATNSYVSYKYMKDGATPITCSDDILELLRLPRRDTGGQEKINFTDNENFKILGEIEKKIIETLQRDRKNKDALVRELVLDPKIANVLLSALEIEGWIKEEDGVMRVA